MTLWDGDRLGVNAAVPPLIILISLSLMSSKQSDKCSEANVKQHLKNIFMMPFVALQIFIDNRSLFVCLLQLIKRY